MSDDQEVRDTVPPSHRPDRPIETAAQDRLGRDGFVARLARALVTPAGRASGVVVGLTGPWGSGKSSVLNLLEAEIERQHPGSVIVRFDPWLVSGRDDVITQFFAELLAKLNEVVEKKGRDWTKLKGAVHKLSGYAKDLAPAAGLLSLVPGIGAVASVAGATAGATAKMVESLTAARTTSLATQHKELRALLADVAVPIVVLVDELDRVEDAEVRAVAQLVRAVVDFPGISYLLAYDRRRVVEALGGGDRGGAYLEKIVQLELPLPATLSGEIDELLVAEFADAAPPEILPARWREDRRFRRIVASAAGGLVATQRDVRRVCGIYAVLAPMVAGEVDWADLLGYAILVAKAPAVIEAIRREPALVVRDAAANLSIVPDWGAFADTGSGNPGELLLRLGIDLLAPPVRLLGELFPRLRTGDQATEARGEPEPIDGLRHYRPLMTVLRLGLLPGAVSRSELQHLVTLEGEAKLEQMRLYFTDGRLAPVLDRLLNLYAELGDRDPDGTLRALGRLSHDLNPETLAGFLEARRYDDVFDEVAKQVATVIDDGVAICRRALAALIQDGQFDGPATLLRHQFFAHGLFGQGMREPGNRWLPGSLVEDLSAELGQAIVGPDAPLDVAGLLAKVRSAHSLLLAVEVGAWTADHRAELSRRIECDDETLRRILLIFYGDGIIGADVLDRIVDAELVHRLVSAEPEGAAWENPIMVATRATALRILSRG